MTTGFARSGEAQSSPTSKSSSSTTLNKSKPSGWSGCFSRTNPTTERTMPPPPHRRPIRLREWEPTVLELTPDELTDLRHAGADLTIQPAGGSQYVVQARSIVGSVVTPRLHVLIEPKLDLDRVF